MSTRAEKTTLERIDALIDKANAVRATHKPNPPGVIGFPTTDSEAFTEWATQGVTFLENLLGPNHTYTNAFRSEAERGGYTGVVSSGIGVLSAVREDVEGGYMSTVETLISAEVFSDFLDMETLACRSDCHLI